MVKDVPISEIVLRKYERPYGIEKRDLVKKVCLSLGLLQPGDSRDVIVDILSVLIDHREDKKKLDSFQVKDLVEKSRKKNNLELKGVAESNIRRQLKRLRDLMIIEKNSNLYYISEFEPLERIFEDKIEKFLVEPSVERIKEYLKELEK
jgi:DNA-binding transcriptional ArsR family regulator